MEKLLTIVIPVYKVEKYIRQCLDSVLLPEEQMKCLEVIVVNDGTPDKSGTIAHEYEAKYPQTIRVIDKENGGHGSAWNIGLKEATGKYIRFLDSDDWLTNLSEFITELNNHDEDLIFTNLVRYDVRNQSYNIDKIRNIKYHQPYNTDSFSVIDTNNSFYIYNFWYCTYKTIILQPEHPLFAEKVYYDDAILFLAPFILGKTIVFFDINLYNYRIGQSGQSVNVNVEKKHAHDYIKVCKGLIDFSNKHQNINKNKKKQRDTLLFGYMKNRFSLFSQLPYRECRTLTDKWLQYIKHNAPYIKLSPKIKFYNAMPKYFGWYCIHLFNKYILKIK